MDENNANLISKNINDHSCMPANFDNAIECARKAFCRLLVGTNYKCVPLESSKPA